MRFLSALAVLFALCLSPMSYGQQYYAKLTTSVSGGSTGGGKVYASNSPTAIANAPPEPPSPITVAINGTLSVGISYKFLPIASD